MHKVKFIPNKGMYFIIMGQRRKVSSNVIEHPDGDLVKSHAIMYGQPQSYVIYNCLIRTPDLIKAMPVIDLDEGKAIHNGSTALYYPTIDTDFIQVDPEIMRDCSVMIEEYEKDKKIGEYAVKSNVLLLTNDILNEFESGLIGQNDQALKEILRIANRK